jgi:hypothetical protein
VDDGKIVKISDILNDILKQIYELEKRVAALERGEHKPNV